LLFNKKDEVVLAEKRNLLKRGIATTRWHLAFLL
jgi:hypothetical protein